MACLGAKNYDPAVAVTKSTAALLAITAMDTVNLRIAFPVPASGRVLVRLQGTLHGAATYPQVLLGVLEGATVIARKAPMAGLLGVAAAATFCNVEVLATIEGLTPGAAKTWDAAYGVESVVAATGIKYGGPNNATVNDAFGAFTFEVWEA
jgi:hypothetical protein